MPNVIRKNLLRKKAEDGTCGSYLAQEVPLAAAVVMSIKSMMKSCLKYMKREWNRNMDVSSELDTVVPLNMLLIFPCGRLQNCNKTSPAAPKSFFPQYTTIINDRTPQTIIEVHNNCLCYEILRYENAWKEWTPSWSLVSSSDNTTMERDRISELLDLYIGFYS